jgi:hypothetical protein
MDKWTNGQIYKCTNVQMYKWINVQMCTAPKKRESFFLKTLITDLFAAIDFFCQAKFKTVICLYLRSFLTLPRNQLF